MKSQLSKSRFPRFLFRLTLAATIVIGLNGALAAQEPAQSSTDIQREAMRKLSFLAGSWSGPITIVRGPGEPLHRTQTEDVQYKLDGLVLLIEGKSTASDGKVSFSALATVAYDDASRAYRFRAYNNGRYVDTELSVQDGGFSWQYQAGPAHIVNTMHLTKSGEWSEVTEATFGNNPPQRSVDMLLQHRP
jgi:hypothetical protein